MKKVLIPKDEAQLKEWVSLLDRGAGVPFRYVAIDGQVAIEVDEKDVGEILGIADLATAQEPPKKKRLPRWARITLWVLGVWTVLAIILPKGADDTTKTTTEESAPAPIDSAALRREMIERQFSAWDGSHIAVTQAIKASMNDPKSYDHVETRFWDMQDHLVIRTKFRGANAFGGVILGSVYAKVDLQGNILEIKQE